MESVKALTTQLAIKTGLTAAIVDDDPPTQANMVDLSAVVAGGRATEQVRALIIGEAATPRLLTGASWFGWDARLGVAVLIGPVNGGYDVTVSTTKAFAEVLKGVAGVYSHVGIGRGTLAGDTIKLEIMAVEEGD